MSASTYAIDQRLGNISNTGTDLIRECYQCHRVLIIDADVTLALVVDGV